jgi:uncharacterized protein with PIN domain
MSVRVSAYHPPRHEAIGPVSVNCPRCGQPLGFALRITMESALNAAKRPSLPEAFLTCPNCRRAFVAGLHLSLAAFAVDRRAA